MTRIQFSVNSDGSDPYALTLNPIDLDLQDSENQNIITSLDGGAVIQSNYFDNRPRVFKWQKIPDTVNSFSTQLDVLKSYIGTIKYVNFNDADYRVTPTSWDKFRVVDLKIEADHGGTHASFLYNVELILYPEP